jgi:hypothetical protein
VYNCSEFSNADVGISATYNDGADASVTGNHAPYCQELYNARYVRTWLSQTQTHRPFTCAA